MVRIERIAGTGSLDACRRIRREVFIDEQGVTEEEEWDGLDESCVHFLARVPDPVGTARLLVPTEGPAKAQRVAVLAVARKTGVGAALMHALEAEAARRGRSEIVLGAQVQALGFYQSLGYEAYGPEFDEAGIPHRMMRKTLDEAG